MWIGRSNVSAAQIRRFSPEATASEIWSRVWPGVAIARDACRDLVAWLDQLDLSPHGEQAFLGESHIIDEALTHCRGVRFLRPVLPLAPRHELPRPREDQSAVLIDAAANMIEMPMRQHDDIDIARLITSRRQTRDDFTQV